MFKPPRLLVLMIGAALAQISSTTASYALSGSLSTTINPYQGSSCGVGNLVSSAGLNARVAIFGPPITAEYAGGSEYVSNTSTPRPAITVAALTACGFTGVSNLQQNGADSSFAADDYIGFSFVGTAPGDAAPSQFEIAVSGVTGTVLINTKAPLPRAGIPSNQATAAFAQARASALIAQQPDLIPFLQRTGSATLNANVTRNRANFDFASAPVHPVWAHISARRTDQDGSRFNYGFAAVGAHAVISDTTLVGMMLQFDHQSQRDSTKSISGDGWLAGPYIVSRMRQQPLYFEGRLLYGETDNDLTPAGSTVEHFESERWLAQFKVAGQIHKGRTTLSPFVDVAYTSDHQDAYLDSTSTPVAAQRVNLGQVEAGIDFAHPLDVSHGDLTLTGGVSGIWSELSGSGTATTLATYEGGRARVELGMTYQPSANMELSGGVHYDGIGSAGYDAYGLSLRLTARF